MNSTVKTTAKKAPSQVTVIGGSAAGLFSAYLLAREGVRVQLFDSNDVMNMTPRTLIVTSGLQDALGFTPTEAIVNEVNDIHLSSANREARVALNEPDLIVERAAMVKLLAQKALAAGVQIQGKTRLVGLRPAKNGALATLRDADGGTVEVETGTLIGADGASSAVGKLSKGHILETVPLLQAIVQLPTRMPRNSTKVWFRPEDTPYFYWLIPHSDTEAAVGFIAGEGTGARDKLAAFVDELGLQCREIQGARIPLFSTTVCTSSRVGKSEVYFVGDAAAQVKVTTVGGLVTGLRGAKAAVGKILRNGQFRQESGGLRRELVMHYQLRRVLNRFGARDYDRLVGMLDSRVHRLLSRYNRDQFLRFAFKLVLAQPRLLRFLPLLFRS